jgi:molybdenum cofactor cytidylyltransferase
VTVAAVVLAASPESALADADGSPAVRRIADAAWSGGATPIIVVSSDPEGTVATALAGGPVTLAEPAPPERGPAAQMARGIDVARDQIHETDAALLWPARLTWVGPETITTLIEAHGLAPERMLIPAFEGERGWPVLLPTAALAVLRDVDPSRMPSEIVDDLSMGGVAMTLLELGDPGAVHDNRTPRADLPAYVGPSEPLSGHVHEWGAVRADLPDDGPLDGPTLARYEPDEAADRQPAG